MSPADGTDLHRSLENVRECGESFIASIQALQRVIPHPDGRFMITMVRETISELVTRSENGRGASG